jgi:hypothetical protein
MKVFSIKGPPSGDPIATPSVCSYSFPSNARDKTRMERVNGNEGI